MQKLAAGADEDRDTSSIAVTATTDLLGEELAHSDRFALRGGRGAHHSAAGATIEIGPSRLAGARVYNGMTSRAVDGWQVQERYVHRCCGVAAVRGGWACRVGHRTIEVEVGPDQAPCTIADTEEAQLGKRCHRRSGTYAATAGYGRGREGTLAG